MGISSSRGGEALGPSALVVGEIQLPPASSAWRTWGGRWTLQTPQELLVADHRLRVQARFPLPSPWRGQHAVSPDLRTAVLSLPDRIQAVNSAGSVRWEFCHAAWGRAGSESGSVAVTAAGAAWATVPGEDGPDRWLVLDAMSGALLGDLGIDCRAAGSEPVLHPDGASVGLSVGEGQDGSAIFWGLRDERGWRVREVVGDRDRVLADVRPDGQQYLTTPHAGGGIAVHDRATDRVVARRSGEELFGPEQEFDYVAGYLDQSLIVAGSREYERLVLLDADTLDVIGEVELPPDAEHGPPVTGGKRSWVTGNWITGRTQLLAIPD